MMHKHFDGFAFNSWRQDSTGGSLECHLLNNDFGIALFEVSWAVCHC